MKARSRGSIDLSHLGIQPLIAHSVSGLAKPLLSISEVTNAGKAVVFLRNSVLIVQNPANQHHYLRLTGTVSAEGSRRNKFYYLPSRHSVSF